MSKASTSGDPQAIAAAGRTWCWRARHTVLAVLFVTSIVSFMDRMVMSAAVPFIGKDFGLSAFESGILMSVFFAGYAIAQVPGGMLADRFGVRRVTTVAMLWWSAFAALTGSTGGLASMLVARLLFGLGEGVYPASAFKAVAVWFPPRERATANAIKLASTPLGGALAPLLVVGVMAFGTWRTVFHVLMIPGIIIAVLFWIIVRDDPAKSPRVTPEELAELGSDQKADVPREAVRMSLRAALREPGMLGYFLVLFTFNIGNWGFTGWLPTYLVKVHGFSAAQMGIAASLPFFAATVGCLVGGWASDRFFSRNRRFPIMATQLASAVFLWLTYSATNTTMLIVCQTMTGFFLSVFSSTFWALPITTMPKALMGVLTGFINTAGQIAAFLSPILVGYLVGSSGGSFGSAFTLLVGSILLSCVLVLTLPRTRRHTG